MRFEDIIGQELVKEQLLQSIREGRVPHAQLFSGPSGVGKLQLAIAYAQMLIGIDTLEHPDLHFVFPIVKNESGDICDDFIESFRHLIETKHYFDLDDWYEALGVETKQGLIYEKESGEIIRKLSLKSFSGGYKVMIIWQPEKMHINCSNKLLKLLEEPPERTVFILVSDQPEMILPTILSRCQQIRIPKLSDEAIASALVAAGQNETAARDLAHIASGSYLTARKLSDETAQNNIFFDYFVNLMRKAWLVGHKKDYAALQELRDWSLSIADTKVGREKQKAFLQYAQRQVRENFISNFGEPQLVYQTTSERDFSKRFAPFIHSGNVEQIMTELQKAEVQITQNGNAKIIFFDLCLQMIVLIK